MGASAGAVRTERAWGSLAGLALGDALGAQTEFVSRADILRRWPPAGPEKPPGPVFRVTDDTQMALAVGEAILEAEASAHASPVALEAALRKAFVAWNRSPENNRAPGVTCMRACAALEWERSWQRATVPSSKGCGANMRVTPVGLLGASSLAYTEEEMAGLAQLQAGMTHGHPTGLAASVLTARTVSLILEGVPPERLVASLTEYARAQRLHYCEGWLGELWTRLPFTSAAEYISLGWDECLEVLDRLSRAEQVTERHRDPCEFTGEGWIAEEAFATGLLCFLWSPDDGRKAIQLAAATQGDSDSIACLTGAFAGAWLGADAWPEDWLLALEYYPRLRRLATALEPLDR